MLPHHHHHLCTYSLFVAKLPTNIYYFTPHHFISYYVNVENPGSLQLPSCASNSKVRPGEHSVSTLRYEFGT